MLACLANPTWCSRVPVPKHVMGRVMTNCSMGSLVPRALGFPLGTPAVGFRV